MTNNNSQRGFAMPIIIAIVAVVLVLGGVVYYSIQSRIQEDKMAQEKAIMEKEAMEQKEKDAIMGKKGDEMMKKDEGAMMDKGETMIKYSGAVLAGKSAPLLDYNKADYDAAVKSDKLVALYFVANWCPICKVELPKLYAAFNELTIDKVVGFQVNYNDSDTDANEKALASQFGVAYQHTKVFLKNGQRILKSPESWSKEQHLSEINKALAQ
jgi:thiol-disulfide isomerase/thioredoxin